MKRYSSPKISEVTLSLESLLALSEGTTPPSNIQGNRSIGADDVAYSNQYNGIWANFEND